ncbi:MAG: hypothetical protein ACI9W4_001754 [Rhodothermales bacterium]|jgi:hypothetical protein
MHYFTRMKTLLMIAALVLAGCTAEGADPILPGGPLSLALDVQEMVVPADTLSGEPYLISADGQVHLSWLDRTSTGAAMRLARMDGASWGLKSTIAAGDRWFVNWADVPSIVSNGPEMWAHWLEYNGDGRYSYGVRVSHSQDAGQTWETPTWLHDDRSPVEHGFGAMAASGGKVHAVWLDGRKWAEGVQEMTVRTRSLGETPGPEFLIDDLTCDCCPNAMTALDDGGLIMAYRNRTETEVRDIHVARMVDGSWEEPKAVHEDGWEIAACPVNGPALDASHGNVAIAWFTAPNDQPQVNVAFSNDSGETFGAPIRMDTGAAIGRVDVVLLDDGTAIASWIQGDPATGGSEAGITARRVAPDGRQSEAVTVVPTSSSRTSGYPRMVRDGDALVFAWTGTQPTRSVRTARAVMTL